MDEKSDGKPYGKRMIVTFECETITPMFLRGADGRTPELRAPSIKGAMRYWWRAINGHLSPKDLLATESAIFGGTDNKSGKSRVLLKVVNRPHWANEKYRPLPHHSGTNQCNIFLSDQSCKGRSPRDNTCTKGTLLPAYRENNTFMLQVAFQKASKPGTEQIMLSGTDWIKDILIVTFVLGGLGARSRRGFGSVAVKSINDSDFLMPDSLEVINAYLNRINTSKNSEYFKLDQDSIKSTFPKNNYPVIREIKLGEPYMSMDKLLATIGNASHQYNPTGSNYLGYARGKNRYASQVYTSVLQVVNNSTKQYIPIITTLSLDALNDKNVIAFKGAILGV
jgi:CRISPR-associated protein Cmr1